MTRFWMKVNKLGRIPQHNTSLEQCWEWMGALSNNGYGRFHLNGINRHAHHVAWELSIGSRKWLQVLYKCNHRQCVNP